MSTMQAHATPPRDRLVGAWLLLIAVLVAAMVVVGGATRLTDSGLSITEWNFARQFVPPLNDAEWARAFELYQRTTEYQLQNHGMSLSDFRYIFFWEWGHRFLGQTIGLVFFLPFLGFWASGRLKGRFWAVLGLGLLGGLQGAVGWWMVTSGLFGRLDVSPLRLAVHLGIAFAIIAYALHLALDALALPRGISDGGPRRGWILFLGLVFYTQVLLGALMAGSHAGKAFGDWPTIGGRWLPDHPHGGSWAEHLATIQFHHRTLGYLVLLLTLLLAALWAQGVGPARRAGALAAVLAFTQVVLGISAILFGVPLWLGLLHQGVAILLWAAIVMWDKAAATR